MSTITRRNVAPVSWEILRERIELGDADGVVGLLSPYPAAELKHLLKDLAAHRRALRERERTDRWGVLPRWRPLLTAAALCVETPAQAGSWFGPGVAGSVRWIVTADDTPHPAELLTSRHDKAWTGDLALRLAAKLTPAFDYVYWRFVEDLVRHSGIEVPLNPGYIGGWLWAAWWERDPERGHGKLIRLSDWLSRQPRLRDCVLAIFETDGVGTDLIVNSHSRRPADDGWSHAVRELVDAGLLDRGEVLDAGAARLISGDRPGSLRGFLAFFEELEPSAAEVRQRIGAFSAMAASGAGAVAKYAQRELRAVDAQQPLDPRDLAELSESVLARPEAGLAGTQLMWLDVALKRDPGAIALLVVAFEAAFAHPSSGVQQKAIKLLAGHRDKVRADAAVMAGLRAAAENLDPALKAEADRVLSGGDGDDGGGASGGAGVDSAGVEAAETAMAVEPAAYRPAPLPALPATPGELVTAFAASYTRGELSALEVEQIMAATAIGAHQDRDALAEAFRPLADRHANDPFRALEYWQLQSFPTAVRCLFQAVLGQDMRIGRRIRVGGGVIDPSPITVTLLRIQELTDALLQKRTVPVLLATPTESSGAIDPVTFAERMALYAAEKVEPLPFDLEHARIRVSPEWARRTEDDERAVAEMLAPRALSDNTMEEFGKPRVGAVTSRRTKVWELFDGTPSVHGVLYPQLAWDGTVRWPLPDLTGVVHEIHRWPTLLPHDPDQVAAHALGLLFEQTRGGNRERSSVFPQLAETVGRPGPLTHLALCYGLVAERVENRVAAQDALLILAARGLLRPELLGEYGAELWQRQMISGARLLESLGRAEQAGMPADIFGVCVALIGGLARRPDTRGLPDLLLLATRSAVGAGISGVDVPGLAALAALPKPKRVAAEAARLREVIVR